MGNLDTGTMLQIVITVAAVGVAFGSVKAELKSVNTILQLLADTLTEGVREAKHTAQRAHVRLDEHLNQKPSEANHDHHG